MFVKLDTNNRLSLIEKELSATVTLDESTRIADEIMEYQSNRLSKDVVDFFHYYVVCDRPLYGFNLKGEYVNLVGDIEPSFDVFDIEHDRNAFLEMLDRMAQYISESGYKTRFVGELVAHYKPNIFRLYNLDKYIKDRDLYSVHTEERIAYSYEYLPIDIMKAYVSVKYYEKYDLPKDIEQEFEDAMANTMPWTIAEL